MTRLTILYFLDWELYNLELPLILLKHKNKKLLEIQKPKKVDETHIYFIEKFENTLW